MAGYFFYAYIKHPSTYDVVPSADCHGKPPLILFFKHLNKRASVTNEIK